jgi:hypothetical protein
VREGKGGEADARRGDEAPVEEFVGEVEEAVVDEVVLDGVCGGGRCVTFSDGPPTEADAPREDISLAALKIIGQHAANQTFEIKTIALIPQQANPRHVEADDAGGAHARPQARRALRRAQQKIRSEVEQA